MLFSLEEREATSSSTGGGAVDPKPRRVISEEKSMVNAVCVDVVRLVQ